MIPLDEQEFIEGQQDCRLGIYFHYRISLKDRNRKAVIALQL